MKDEGNRPCLVVQNLNMANHDIDDPEPPACNRGDGQGAYLCNEFEHNVQGDRTLPIDPKGIETRFEYDATGGLSAVVENYVSGGGVDHQTNVRTEYSYAVAGNRVEQTNSVRVRRSPIGKPEIAGKPAMVFDDPFG